MFDRVLVKKDDARKITESGIHIPEGAVKEKQIIGTVLAVGDGNYSPDAGTRIPIALKPGDRVMFGIYAGTEFEYEAEKYVVLHESDVLTKFIEETQP